MDYEQEYTLEHNIVRKNLMNFWVLRAAVTSSRNSDGRRLKFETIGVTHPLWKISGYATVATCESYQKTVWRSKQEMAYGKSNGHVTDNVMTLKGECHDLNMSGPISSTAAADTDLVTMTTTLRGQGHDCQSASHLLSVPRHNLSFGARAFRVAAPKIWNSIPLQIHQSQTYSSFRRHDVLLSFSPSRPLAAPVMRPDSLLRLWCYIILLLNY